jgi:hypothetical protein
VYRLGDKNAQTRNSASVSQIDPGRRHDLTWLLPGRWLLEQRMGNVQPVEVESRDVRPRTRPRLIVTHDEAAARALDHILSPHRHPRRGRRSRSRPHTLDHILSPRVL